MSPYTVNVRMLAKWIQIVAVACVLCLLPKSLNAWAATVSQPFLISEAKIKELATSRPWHKLLMIPDTAFLPRSSIVTDPSFFISGEADPEKELRATIAAFFAPTTGDNNAHARCVHAARWEWFKDQVGIIEDPKTALPCKNLAIFLDVAHYEQVAIVFTNYFITNPASMFGHTFLKLRHTARRGAKHHDLLDDAANFAASVDPDDVVLYPIKGLFGGYDGIFSLYPYHRKTQEYNNFESRDLWEYTLDLDAKETKQLTLMLWELGGKKLAYFYLNRNCSNVMLSLLEAAAPRLHLTSHFYLYAVPADTLRAVLAEARADEPPLYRPSSLSRYVIRLKRLSPTEVDLLTALVKEDSDYESGEKFLKSSPQWQACDQSCRVRILDAALEFFDYEERLAGDHEPERYGKIRKLILAERAAITITSTSLDGERASTAIDLGHPSALIEAKVGLAQGGEPFWQARWRPALHDLSAGSTGYNLGMELKFLDITLRSRPHEKHVQPYLQDLVILSTMALPTELPLVHPVSWNYAIGMERDFAGGPFGGASRNYFRLGGGKSWGDHHVLVYTMLDLNLAAAPGGFHFGPMALWGIIYEAKPYLKLISTNHLEWILPQRQLTVGAHNTVAYSWNASSAVLLSLDHSNHWEISVGGRYYF